MWGVRMTHLSCRWVTPHAQMSHVTHINEPCHSLVTPHVQMRQKRIPVWFHFLCVKLSHTNCQNNICKYSNDFWVFFKGALLYLMFILKSNICNFVSLRWILKGLRIRYLPRCRKCKKKKITKSTHCAKFFDLFVGDLHYLCVIFLSFFL